MKHPIILDKKHPFTRLVVNECHARVMHGGVKETLTQLRSKYWIVRGRQFVRMLLSVSYANVSILARSVDHHRHHYLNSECKYHHLL